MIKAVVTFAGEGCSFDYPKLCTLFLPHSNPHGFGMAQSPATGWVFQEIRAVIAHTGAGTGCSCNPRHWLGHLVLCFEGKRRRGKGVLSFELSAKDPQSCQRTDISKDLSNLASTQKGLSLSFNT